MRISLALDAAVVIAFVAIGRSSHDEAASLSGFAGTLWPFAAGLLVGVLLSRRDRTRLPAGLVTWACTLVLGMLLRLVSGQGVAASFILVAAAFLALMFLGWRTVALLLTGREHARS
ncbi:MAG TPA: DUF3054 domain-containing protein [Mycobacteriales bacterium]|nr:DUF3054 domain-containing protein [Mycobacteriales bacterium]